MPAKELEGKDQEQGDVREPRKRRAVRDQQAEEVQVDEGPIRVRRRAKSETSEYEDDGTSSDEEEDSDDRGNSKEFGEEEAEWDEEPTVRQNPKKRARPDGAEEEEQPTAQRNSKKRLRPDDTEEREEPMPHPPSKKRSQLDDDEVEGDQRQAKKQKESKQVLATQHSGNKRCDLCKKRNVETCTVVKTNGACVVCHTAKSRCTLVQYKAGGIREQKAQLAGKASDARGEVRRSLGGVEPPLITAREMKAASNAVYEAQGYDPPTQPHGKLVKTQPVEKVKRRGAGSVEEVEEPRSSGQVGRPRQSTEGTEGNGRPSRKPEVPITQNPSKLKGKPNPAFPSNESMDWAGTEGQDSGKAKGRIVEPSRSSSDLEYVSPPAEVVLSQNVQQRSKPKPVPKRKSKPTAEEPRDKIPARTTFDGEMGVRPKPVEGEPEDEISHDMTFDSEVEVIEIDAPSARETYQKKREGEMQSASREVALGPEKTLPRAKALVGGNAGRPSCPGRSAAQLPAKQHSSNASIVSKQNNRPSTPLITTETFYSSKCLHLSPIGN